MYLELVSFTSQDIKETWKVSHTDYKRRKK